MVLWFVGAFKPQQIDVVGEQQGQSITIDDNMKHFLLFSCLMHEARNAFRKRFSQIKRSIRFNRHSRLIDEIRDIRTL